MRASIWSLAVLGALVVAGLFGLLALTGRPIPMPVWLVAEAEERLNAALAPAMPGASISVGGIEVMVDRDWQPRLRIQDLRLLQPDGASLLVLPDARIAFDGAGMLTGRVLPRDLRLTGARIAVRRDADGRFDISLGNGAGTQLDSFGALLDVIDSAFAAPSLARLGRIEADALTVQLRDDRTARTWNMGDGRLVLDNQSDEVAAELSLSLAGGDQPARARIVAISEKRESRARVTASVEGVAARDLAAQAAPLAWLGALDAPLSGELSASLDADGVSDLQGRLDIGPGALQPLADATPVAFTDARVTFGYDPAHGRINLSEIGVESPSLRLSARGHADLVDAAGRSMTGALGGRLPAAFVTQIDVDRAMVDPAGVFESPVTFTDGAFDLRLRLDPFSVDVGQLSLTEGNGTRLSSRGLVGAGPGGWSVAMDLSLNHIGRDRLLQLWPVRLVPKSREWMEQNLLEGELSDLRAGLRLTPGADPRLALTWDFDDAELRFIKTLPPVKAAGGYAAVEGARYTMVVSRGQVEPPEGGPVDVTGTVFRVGDITQKPAQAELQLRAKGSVTAGLTLLDQPPFRFLAKAGRGPDLAEGRAEIAASATFPLKPKVATEEVAWSVNGLLFDVRSTRLVPGKTLTADRLDLKAENDVLRISGPARIGSAEFTGRFQQSLVREDQGRARLEAEAAITPEALAEFDIDLPKGMVGGAGEARVGIDFAKGVVPRMSLTSDLKGLALALPEIGWAKPRAAAGKLDVQAALSKPAQVERLSLDAPGLSATGTVSLGQNGMERAVLSRVRVGDWLDAPVELRGRGKGRSPAVLIQGGMLDLRRLDDRARGADGGGGAASGGAPVGVSLDRLVVNDSLAITGLRGEFATTGGLNGTFTGRVNGTAPISGTVVPAKGGTAVRIAAADAGAVLAAAGVFRGVTGGELQMQLLPRGPKGSWDGTVAISNFRVRNAPVLAELLSAISVVGLLEQLGGSGIAFMNAEGDFVVTPERIVVGHGAATGASMGVSLAGSYTFAGKALDMQGVISPIYLLNAVGQVVSRRGEGLFGFNYRVRGTAAQPAVSVNPLSILTPGIFREIFRRPAPGVNADE